jgi:hypothetical protein
VFDILVGSVSSYSSGSQFCCFRQLHQHQTISLAFFPELHTKAHTLLDEQADHTAACIPAAQPHIGAKLSTKSTYDLLLSTDIKSRKTIRISLLAEKQ